METADPRDTNDRTDTVSATLARKATEQELPKRAKLRILKEDAM
jgi:hypothetical protein